MGGKARGSGGQDHEHQVSHLEAIKLKGHMIAQLKEREGELMREHGRVVDAEAKLDHCEVLRRLAKNRA